MSDSVNWAEFAILLSTYSSVAGLESNNFLHSKDVGSLYHVIPS